MDKAKIRENINKYPTWYQSYNFDGIRTRKEEISGPRLWKDIRSMLPKSIKGKKILDIGCNAGFHSIHAAIEGAKVTGVEIYPMYYAQSLFAKEFYEEKHGKLKLQLLNERIEYVDFNKHGPFDYVFALSILYHVGKKIHKRDAIKMQKEETETIKKLTKISNNILVRAKGTLNMGVVHYDNKFIMFGFQRVKMLSQGKRVLVLYRRK